jgi:hypothetical protein
VTRKLSVSLCVFRAPLHTDIPPAPTAVTVADCVALPAPQDNGVVTEMVAETTTGSAIVIAAAGEVHPFASVITTV